VEIIAHRGASHDAPENTLAAVNLAWQQNADAVEIDVHLSRDGQIVVIHDENTRKTAGLNKNVSEQTLAELRRLDVGRWKGRQWAGEKIPVLAEVLGALPAVAVAAFVSQSSGKVVWVLILYFVISNVVYNFISPKVFGDAVHLSPMLIIIAFVVGGYLGGILGLFVAVPVAATLRILFIYAHERIYA